MNIERLKELKSEVSNMAFIAFSKLTDKNARANIVKTGNDLQKLIDEAIARQSVKSEEVTEAINELESAFAEEVIVNGLIGVFSEYQFKVETIDLAITALQAYQAKEPCEWCDAENINFRIKLDGGYHCKFCGRKLRENER